jgi:hypothetical protein
MAKTLKRGTYCSIAAYLEDKDQELHSLLSSTCTLDAVDRAPRRTAGLTFIMPVKDHPCRGEIAKLIESSNPKDLQKAADMIQAMIIRDYMTPNDWKRTTPDIPNFQFPSKKVSVISASAGEIKLKGEKGEAVLKPHTGFIDGSKRGNLLIYDLVSGMPQYTGGEVAQMPARAGAKPKGLKRGGYVAQAEEAMKLRFLLGVQMENEFAAKLLSGQICGCIRNCAAGLVKFLKSNHADIYAKILCLLQRDESDFYTLVEPHLHDSTPLIPDEVIAEWAKSPEKCNDFAGYCDMICADIANVSGRAEIQDEAIGQGGLTTANLVEKYADAAKSGKLGGVKLFPNADLEAYYSSNPSMKLVHDELKFFLPSMFNGLKSAQNKLEDFKAIVQWVGQVMHSRYSSLAKNQEILNVFKNSSSFFYVCSTVAEMEKRKRKAPFINDAINSRNFYSPDWAAIKHSNRIDESGDINSVIAQLTSGKVSISEEQKKKLMDFLTTSG